MGRALNNPPEVEMSLKEAYEMCLSLYNDGWQCSIIWDKGELKYTIVIHGRR